MPPLDWTPTPSTTSTAIDAPVDVEALRRNYTPEPVPPCRVCGAALVIGKIGGGEPTEWSCPNADNDMKHYRQAHFKQRRVGDSRVLALLSELERVRGEQAFLSSTLEASCSLIQEFIDENKWKHELMLLARLDRDTSNRALVALQARVIALEGERDSWKAAFAEAADDAIDFADYADNYFQQKYKIPERVARHRSLLAQIAASTSEVGSGETQ